MSSMVHLFTLITDIGIVAVATGLIFSLLVQPERTNTNVPFIALCSIFGIWGTLNILLRLPTENITIDKNVLVRLEISTMHLLALSYFIFFTTTIKPTGFIARLLKFSVLPAIMVAIVLTWMNNTFSWDADSSAILFNDVSSYVILGIATTFLGASFWMSISSEVAKSRFLQLPALLMILAWLSYMITPLRELPLTNTLGLAALTFIGWIILSKHLFNPLESANAELRASNRNLQQVINELAGEKEKTENLNKGLREANQYKSEFLANISHELRTPLNSIIGYSELLKTGIYGSLTDKQQDRVDKIHRNGSQLLDLISDILDLNKIDAGKLKLDAASFTLEPLIKNVESAIGAQCEQKNLKLSAQFDKPLPRLFGDEKRILQVLSNLADNAVKFTSAGSIVIKATGAQVKNGRTEALILPMLGWLRDGDWLIISVQDTGIGIAPEDQGRIFDEFSQIDGSRNREFSGIGLGLAISKRLTELHGGVIWVKSELGMGSTFYVALPADFQAYEAPNPDEIGAANSQI